MLLSSAFDKGAEVQRIAEHGGVVLPAQSRPDQYAEGCGRTSTKDYPDTRPGKISTASVRVDIGGTRCRIHCRLGWGRSVQLQLLAQPARACREFALRHVCSPRLSVDCRCAISVALKFGGRISAVQLVREKKCRRHRHSCASRRACRFHSGPDGHPVRVIRQLLQAGGRGARRC